MLKQQLKAQTEKAKPEEPLGHLAPDCLAELILARLDSAHIQRIHRMEAAPYMLPRPAMQSRDHERQSVDARAPAAGAKYPREILHQFRPVRIAQFVEPMNGVYKHIAKDDEKGAS